MSDNLMEKVSAFGERLKIGGAEVGRKMSAGMSSMSFKVKELLQGPNQADKLVEDATAETLDEPDWAMNLDICDMIDHEKVSSVELIRGIKKRIMIKNARSLKSRGIRFPGRDNESLVPIFTPPRSVSAPEVDTSLAQHIEYDIPLQSFTAEQTKEAFDVARNSVELLATVLSSSPQQDALQDDLTTTLVHQCRQSQLTVQRIIEKAGDNEALLFEALNVNDEIQKVLSKYEELKAPSVVPVIPEPAMIPVAVEPDSPVHAKEDALVRKPAGSRGGTHGGSNDDMMDDLDEMIFGKKGGGTSQVVHDPKKQQSSKDDLITF
ncbi:hypothetical protein D5086_033269 [Populus alba]|uniref:Uncharacterized protein n=1 Tax=Populus alba TaxID=43335 RepID=A0ACC4AGD1_POPAL